MKNNNELSPLMRPAFTHTNLQAQEGFVKKTFTFQISWFLLHRESAVVTQAGVHTYSHA